METKSLLFNNLPAWYNILWGSADELFHIEIHEDAIPQLPILKKDMPLMKAIEAELGFGTELFGTFCGNLAQNSFGFNEKIQCVGRRGQFLDFAMKLPSIRKQTHETCEDCSGTGKDENSVDGKCLCCNGQGKKVVCDWREARLANVSLALLLYILNIPPEKDTTSSQLQLATAEIGWTTGSCFVSGHISLIAFNVIKRDAEIIATIAERAMFQADKLMMGERQYHGQSSFRARIDDNFSLDCPGDACGVYTTDGNDRHLSSRSALEYHCHNVDSSLQALTLLVGVAALLGEVRQGFN